MEKYVKKILRFHIFSWFQSRFFIYINFTRIAA